MRLKTLYMSNAEFDERQLQKKWSNLQERLKNKLTQRNAAGGGTSADLNSRGEITHWILRDCNPTFTMTPGLLFHLISRVIQPDQERVLIHTMFPLQQQKLLPFYESGTSYFQEARRYYARLNDDIKKYDERMVMKGWACMSAWIQKVMMITSNDRAIECIIVWDWNLQYFKCTYYVAVSQYFFNSIK